MDSLRAPIDEPFKQLVATFINNILGVAPVRASAFFFCALSSFLVHLPLLSFSFSFSLCVLPFGPFSHARFCSQGADLWWHMVVVPQLRKRFPQLMEGRSPVADASGAQLAAYVRRGIVVRAVLQMTNIHLRKHL